MRWLERINVAVGRTVAWLTLLMVINTVVILLARDAFGFGRIWMQELTTWMHAVVFMLGAAYTLARDEHVRVDILYRRWSPRGQAWVDLIGCALLLLPVCVFLAWTSWGYVFGPLGSWATREGSGQAGGLGFPAPSLVKTTLVIMPVLLALQGVVIAGRALSTLRGKPSA